jgi:redox-sensitive bicupin YhaK (pirin superfamily)
MKAVQKVLRGEDPHWVGDGFPVRTYFHYGEAAAFSPFLLLDYAGPARFEPTEDARGVGPHPHRGFETVTIVYQGEVEHRDSAGNGGRIGPGDVQWMTAASGLVHEEKHGAGLRRDGGTLEMVQLWVNLPARAKGEPPRYQDLLAARIPSAVLPEDAGTVRVIAGAFRDAKGPAKTFTPVDVWDLRLAAGRTATLPLAAGHTALLLVQNGALRVRDHDVPRLAMAVLDRAGTDVEVHATGGDEARVLVLAGAPIPEPVVAYGPFVMNTRDEIATAIDDFHAGRMGRLDG